MKINQLFIIYISILFISCGATKYSYTLLDRNNTEIVSDTFDIEYFEKNKDMSDNVRIQNDNGEYIRIYLSINKYKEIHIPPLPKFYTIYKEYYLNGKLKTRGYKLNELKIGTWEYYMKWD